MISDITLAKRISAITHPATAINSATTTHPITQKARASHSGFTKEIVHEPIYLTINEPDTIDS